MHQDNHLIFEAYSKQLLKEYNPHQINSMFNNMTNSLASNANNLFNNPNLVPALQAVYGHRQQLNQGQQSIALQMNLKYLDNMLRHIVTGKQIGRAHV